MRLVGNWFLAPTAVVTADVTCGPGVNIWFGAVVRGDLAPIRLGDNVNLQDGVIVGHAAVLHGARVGADTLVGIGAKLLSGCEIGPECVIAAGAVVLPGMK